MLTIAQRLAQGFQLHQTGRLEEAQALYRGILEEAPQQADALHFLGLLVHQIGRHDEAIDLLCRCLAAHGPHPLIHCNLGVVYLAGGSLPEAIVHCREAIRLNPGLTVAHFNLGAALRRQGQFEEAAEAFREALRLTPGYVDAQCGLGAVLHKLGKLPEAVGSLKETVRLAPTNPQARHDLGAVLRDCGQGELAAQQLREAIRLKPAFIEAHNNLGLALRDLGRIEEAKQCFREALRLDPTHVKARNNLGNALESEGRLDEALAEFRETVRLDPHNAVAIAALSNLAAAGRFRFTEEDVRAIAQRVGREDLPLDDRHQLHFALALMSDRAGNHADAFKHYRRGNELRQEWERRRGNSFDAEAQEWLVDRLIATFTPAYFEQVNSFGRNSELPIFIVGMMRSGTTLAEQILASHPRVYGAGELPILGQMIDSLPQRLGMAESYPEVIRRLDAATAQTLAEEYGQRLKERGGEAERVVDKMPANFLNLGVIATLFPRARIIHCRRDPIDTCLSCFFHNFGESIPYTLDLRHLGQYYRAYERLMAHWSRVLPMPIFELNYEELTANQEATSRRLVAFCGLEWDERCLRFHETQRVVRTASLLQVRQPLFRSSVGRWKRFEDFLQPLREALADSRE
jgi:tetratricopeptide (TPR) repeat protein